MGPWLYTQHLANFCQAKSQHWNILGSNRLQSWWCKDVKPRLTWSKVTCCKRRHSNPYRCHWIRF